MSHELTTHADGRVEFAFREDHGLPWHGLGQPIAAHQFGDVDAWRVAAGMDWKVQRSKVRYAIDASGTLKTDDENHVLFRSDTHARLGLVSAKYKIVQPAQVLEFFRDIVRAGGLELSAAGTIFGGQRFWATAKIGEAAPVSVRDKIGGYLLLTSSADGSVATEARRTTVRAVCRNTIAMAFADAAASVRVTHRSRFDPADVREFMGLNNAAWDAFKHQIVRLANVSIPVDIAPELVTDIVDPKARKAGTDAIDKVRESAAYGKILALFNGDAIGSSLDGVRGTAWGLLNAVTEYADHHARAHSEENRFASAQWGPGASLKDRALALLMPA